MLTIDAVVAFNSPGSASGSPSAPSCWCVNAALLWLYTLSCHSCRHLCGGHVKSSPTTRSATGSGSSSTPLNAKHMQIAWASLIFVALTDLYVRLVASGAINDSKLF